MVQLLQKANKLLIKKDKFKTSSLCAFRCKLIGEVLPTRQQLNNRYADIYTDDQCPRCLLVTEIQEHVFTCYKNNQVKSIIEQKIKQKITNLANKQYCSKIPSNITNFTNKHNFRDLEELRQIACRLQKLPLNLSGTAQAKLSNHILKLLYNEIWTKRLATANTSLTSGIR